jgi:hypothetical protein
VIITPGGIGADSDGSAFVSEIIEKSTPGSGYSLFWPDAMHGIIKASKITFFMQRDELKKELFLTAFYYNKIS